MALTQIKLANKKSRHEAKRRQKRIDYAKAQRLRKVKNRKMRQMFVEGRREDLRIRRDAKQYVNELEGEITGGENEPTQE